MLRPSRPMIRPFMSSEGSSISDEVVSAAWLAATRWRASATRFRARRFASTCASSSSWRTRRARSCRISSSDCARSLALASLTVIPEIRSSSSSSRCFVCFRSSWSSLTWTSRSERPCSRRSISFWRRFDLVLSCDCPFLDLRDPRALLGDLLLDLGAQADGILAGLDLRLAADRLGFPPGLAHARLAEHLQADEHQGARDQDADQNCRDHEHGAPRVRAGAAQLSECCGPASDRDEQGPRPSRSSPFQRRFW